MTRSDVQTIVLWHEALNAGDAERLLALSDEDVEVGGPRGTGRGRGLLREWVERARIHLEPVRVFQRAGVVVVQQHARWDLPDVDATASPDVVASAFRVRDGLVIGVVRYPDLPAALRATGLHESDEAPFSPTA